MAAAQLRISEIEGHMILEIASLHVPRKDRA